jgi:hypothetical protein
VEIYGKRRHTDLFCVNQNWHISFTRAAVCTEQELATSTRLFVRPSAASDSVLGKPIIDRGGLSVYRVAKPELPVGVPFKVGEQVIAYNNYILKSGWSTIEPKEGFIWSLDNTARLDLHIKHDSATRLLLDLEGFIPKPDYVQEAQIEMDGKPLVSVRFTQQDNRKQVSVPLGPRNSDDVTVTLRFSHPISPQQAGVSSDPRVLGVRLYGITLEGN